jgi:hypothetical protein
VRLLNELLITAMETLGLVFVALGIGFGGLALAGYAGFFGTFGAALLGAAYLSARQQRPKPKPEVPTAPPPVPTVYVKSNNGTEKTEPEKLSKRMKKAFTS